MRYVSLSYNPDPTYNAPQPWLVRVRAYGGVLTALAKHGHVSHMTQIDYEGRTSKDGVQYYFIKCSSETQLIPRKLHQLVKSLKPDVVIVHSFNHPLQVVLLRWALPSKTRIIIQNHAEKPSLGKMKFLQRLADKWVDAYLFTSKNMGLDWVVKGNIASPRKVHEVMELSSIFYPINKQTAQARTGINAGQVYLWAGRLDANKDPITAVKAFLKFGESNPEARLYMLYHTEELLTDIKQLINAAPNPEAVSLIGKIPNDDMLFWFNSADFFLAASYYEGSGTALCEAMSCGCVPIVSDIFSFRMMTDNGNLGLLFSPGDENELLSALNKSLNLDLAAQRAKALAYFKSDLSFEAIAKKIHGIATSLTNAG